MAAILFWKEIIVTYIPSLPLVIGVPYDCSIIHEALFHLICTWLRKMKRSVAILEIIVCHFTFFGETIL